MGIKLKSKNSKRKCGTLSKLLIKNYTMFNLSILIVFGVIYSVLNYYVYITFSLPQIDLFIEKAKNISDNQFMNIKTNKYLGNQGEFILLNENGKTIYTNNPALYSDYLISELESIPNYSDDEYTSIERLKSKDGDLIYFISKRYYNNSKIQDINDYMFLDEKYNIIYSKTPTERKSLTEKEFKFISGSIYDNYLLFKHNYINSEGSERTLIFIIKMLSEEKYMNTYYLFNKSWIVFIFMYIVMSILFIKSMSNKFKKLLIPLNNAIMGFLNGERNKLNWYTGPDEFVDIAVNFDDLAERLIKSEWENSRLNDSRRRLLADISHDLKSPLTVIQGYAIALRDGVIAKDEQEKYLNLICEKSKYTMELLSNFHEYSKLEHPDFPIYFKMLNVCEVFQTYLADKYNEIEFSDFELDVDIPDEIIICKIDRILFCRAIDNIINNSIKYNQKGTTIRLSIRKYEDKVKIIIGDTGVGINRKELDSIFKPFSLGNHSINFSSGSGLGLSICDKIIKVHNGIIVLKYPADNGYSTQFEIVLKAI